MKDSIIFYINHYEIVKSLSNEQLGKLYRTIFEYAMGNEPTVDDDIKIAFGFIKNQMILDQNKYSNKCSRNQENGKLGGRPKKNDEEEKPNGFFEKPKKPNGYFEETNENPKKPNGFFKNPNENENENENDNNNKEVVIETLTDFVQKELGRVLSSSEIEYVLTWEDNELTRHAVKQTVLNRATSLKYTQGIINSYKAKGFKTLAEVEADEKRFEENKLKKSNGKKLTNKEIVDNVWKELGLPDD